MKWRRFALVPFVIACGFLGYRVLSVSRISFPTEAVVKEVIDGDTIRIALNTQVRYIGVDTPEIRFKQGEAWIENPESLALQAKQINKQLVLGKKVRLEYDTEKHDRYHRLLCYVFADDVFVNERILQEGLGFLMTIEPNTKYTEQLHTALIQAKNEGKGIWDKANTKQITADEASDYIGKLVVVEGTILRASKTPKVIFLNFGKDKNNDFTGVIFSRSFDRMKYLGTMKSLKGKKARITGIIKEYNGPEIIINSQEQIEIITAGTKAHRH